MTTMFVINLYISQPARQKKNRSEPAKQKKICSESLPILDLKKGDDRKKYCSDQ